jgi:hypothetical protein
MTGCTEFRQSGSCLIAWQGPTPVAQIAWNAADTGWYINFLSVEQPQLLAPLLSKFWKLWRRSGKSTLSFHASPDNQVIGRLIGILGVECFAGLYTIVNLDHQNGKKKHEQARERTV